MITVRLSTTSGVSSYLQIARQVRHAIRLGLLRPGDQLPTVKEVVTMVAVNPNTVLKAYQLLEHEGLVEGRQGQGTFVTATLAGPSPVQQAALQRGLDKWLERAFAAGLDADDITALFETALRSTEAERSA
jgi:GntR family transcriptional regulator